MNKVILIGNLTKQPDLRFTPGAGKAVATFTLAINEGWGDNKKVTFVNCVAWEKTAEALANYTDKGSKVAVVGKIQNRSYDDKTGLKRYITEVVCNEVEFLDKKSGQEKPASNVVEDVMLIEDDSDIPF